MRAEALAQSVDDPATRARIQMVRGVLALRRGDWELALAHEMAALDAFSQLCIGLYWETGISQRWALLASEYSGNARRTGALLDEFEAQAARRGDLYASMTHRAQRVRQSLYDDDVDRARSAAQSLLDGLAAKNELLPQLVDAIQRFEAIGRSLILLYTGAAQETLAQMHEEMLRKYLRAGWPFRTAQAEVVQARAALALTLRARDPRRVRRSVERSIAGAIRWLEGCGLPWARAWALGDRAALAVQDGAFDDASALLERCEREHASAGTVHCAAAAAYARAGLQRSSDADVRASSARLQSLGFRQPASAVRIYAPGFGDHFRGRATP